MLADLAMRDGQPVAAFDLFGDLDLRRGAARVVALPGGTLTALVDAAVQLPARGVIYGASFENHPGLVARLGERHALLGNESQTLRAVRDPQRLASALRDAGLELSTHLRRGARRSLGPLAAQAVARWRRHARARVARRRAAGWHGRAGAHRRNAVLGGGGRRRGGCGRARAHRAARRTARVRRARLPLVRQPRPAAACAQCPVGAGARHLLLRRERVRPARPLRR